MRLLLAISLVLVCLTSPGAEREDILEENFDTATKWQGLGRSVREPGRGGVLCFQRPDPGVSISSRSLPARELAGTILDCSALVRAEGVGSKPQPWNGIKLMLVIETAEDKSYPQAAIPEGSFDWRPARFTARIPDDVQSVTLVLGLEQVSGKACFDDLQVTLRRPVISSFQRPAERYTGHTLPRLRGAMVSPGIDAQGLTTLARDWQANVIRWQLIRFYTPGQPAPLEGYDTWLEAELNRLDSLLPVCRQNGLKVVLDLHSPPGGKATEHGYVGSDDRLFSDRGCQSKFAEVWRKIALRYRGNEVFWGFDLANEPVEEFVAPDCEDWQGLAERAARVVREIDPDRTLIVEPPRWGSAEGFKDLVPLSVSNVVYSFHMYVPHQFTHQQLRQAGAPITYPGRVEGRTWNQAALKAAMQPAIAFQQKYNVHLYVGEFSAIRWAPGAAEYLKDVVAIFEQQGWDWSYHAFREFHGWSLEHGEDRHALDPVQGQTDRAKVIRNWFRQNQKPDFADK